MESKKHTFVQGLPAASADVLHQSTDSAGGFWQRVVLGVRHRSALLTFQPAGVVVSFKQQCFDCHCEFLEPRRFHDSDFGTCGISLLVSFVLFATANLEQLY